MKCRVVNSHNVLKEQRFDGSYHNAEVNVYDDVITSHSEHNLSYYCSEIFTSGRNRRVYTKPEFGYPFLSNSDAASLNPLATCKFSSKKYGYDETAVLKGGMILTGRVGAIGQTTFVPKYWERYKMMGSDNIIRIVVNPRYKNGFIYAYLASKVGNLSFWKHATGGVQPFITDDMVASLPIPHFPASFQKEVDYLMQESARLREEAMDLFYESKDTIEALFPSFSNYSFSKRVSSKEVINSFNKRFDANYYSAEGSYIETYIKENFSWKSLGDVCESISRPDIFKRYYVKNGVEFLGGADIFLFKPDSEKKLSVSKTVNLENMLIKEGTILLPRSGTIGQVALAHAEHAQKLASEHVIRLVPNNILRAGYVYAFLASSLGEKLIQKFIFGSVIQHVEPPHLKQIPIPVIDEEAMESIHNKVMTYSTKISLAVKKEKQAISMIEQEIEKWNK